MRKFNSVSAAREAIRDYMGENYGHVPTFTLDERRSACAGYPIYLSAIHVYYCDLGDRLELNLRDGTSVNFWYSGALDADSENDCCAESGCTESDREGFTRYFNPDVVDVFELMAFIDNSDRNPLHTYTLVSYLTGEIIAQRELGMLWNY